MLRDMGGESATLGTVRVLLIEDDSASAMVVSSLLWPVRVSASAGGSRVSVSEVRAA